MKYFRLLIVIVPEIVLIGCAGLDYYPRIYTNESPMNKPEDPKILILPAKIEVRYKGASSNSELNSEKSDAVASIYNRSLEKYMASLGMTTIPYNSEVILASDKVLLKKVAEIFDAVISQNISKSSLGASRFFSLNKSIRRPISRYSADYLVVTDMEYTGVTFGNIVARSLINAPEYDKVVLKIGVFDLRDGQFVWGNLDKNNRDDLGFFQPEQEMWDRKVARMFKSFSLK